MRVGQEPHVEHHVGVDGQAVLEAERHEREAELPVVGRVERERHPAGELVDVQVGGVEHHVGARTEHGEHLPLPVDAVEERAVALADANVRLNFGEEAPHTSLAVDAVEYLKDIGDRYDMIILDPPAFAKHHKVLGNAMQGYKRLNARALAQIKSGGLLFTFSCSQAVSKELFRTTVFSAAAIAGRKVRILHQLTQPADHPINIYHPEGEYLKGLVLYVE